MLSAMETSREQLTEAHRALLRAEASPFVDYPRLGRWYPVAWAAWAAWMVTTLHLDVASVPGQFAIAASPAVIALGFLAWYARRHGAMPRSGRQAPPSLARLARLFWIVGITVAVLTTLADALLGPTVSIPFAALSAGIAVAWYEHRYARTADRIRAELA